MASDRQFTARVFGLAVAAALTYALFRILEPFLAPILWALLLAFLLFPANRWLRAKLGGRLGAAAIFLTLAVFLGIVIPFTLITMAFVSQGSDLVARLSSLAGRYRIARPSDLLTLPAVRRGLEWIQDKVPVTTDQIQGWLLDGLTTALQFVLASGRSVFLGALGVIVGLALTLFLLYFFFRDGDGFAARIIRLIPADEDRKRRLVEYLSSVTKAVVLGTLLTALIQGALVGIAFWGTNLSSPVVFGVLAGLFSLLPVGGTAFVWLPGAIVLAGQGRWGAAIFLTLWGLLIVGTADNFLRPLLISGRAQISTLPVFLGVIGGLAAFGAIGLFLGPLLIALALALLRFAEERPAEASHVRETERSAGG
jgi:predicted PurR-regulated permease PerM